MICRIAIFVVRYLYPNPSYEWYIIQSDLIWLVVWNIFYFPIYWVSNHPNWRNHIFQRGGPTTNQLFFFDLVYAIICYKLIMLIVPRDAGYQGATRTPRQWWKFWPPTGGRYAGDEWSCILLSFLLSLFLMMFLVLGFLWCVFRMIWFGRNTRNK